MSKAMTINSHWQTRTGSSSTHASRKGVNLLGWDAGISECMTPTQERDAFVRRLKQLQSLPVKERKLHGQEMYELGRQIQHLRPKMRTPGIEKYIMDILRERLSKREWDALFNEAKRRYAAEQNAQQPANKEVKG